jgi:hypothetical protein
MMAPRSEAEVYGRYVISALTKDMVNLIGADAGSEVVIRDRLGRDDGR